MSNVDSGTIKAKRGRRSKKEIEAAKAQAEAAAELKKEETLDKNENVVLKKETDNNIEFKIDNDDAVDSNNDNIVLEDKDNNDENAIVKQGAKKRGRKPKGGKIIQQTLPVSIQKETKPNIILHLKCSLKDLTSSGDHNSNFTSANVDPYNFGSNNEFSYEMLSKDALNNVNVSVNNESNFTNINKIYAIKETNQNSNVNDDNDELVSTNETREIWRKLKILEQDLHINNISDKKSACFWCSHDFDNPPIYIPKHFIKDSYQVYGCFCTPECAVAHLMEENVDSSTKFERYHLINHIYSKIYEYKKSIKPAPNPHYMLDKYYGNLTIQEYRSLLKSDRLFLIVDKPLTRILPEFHEDNDEFIINNKIIPSNNYQVKKRLQKKAPQTKSNILNEKFGIQNVIAPVQ
jgi:hypothetical protein